MAKKIEEDDQFLELRNKFYDVRIACDPNHRRWPWGGIEPLRDKRCVKIDRDALYALLSEVEEANNVRAALFRFLRIEEFVGQETETLYRKIDEDY